MEFLKNLNLKPREDVIFENASEYEKNCNYSFKVKRDSVKEILSIIESLDPKELNENTYTIKRLIEDYTSELEILQKKLNSIEETLNNAINAYVRDINKIAQDITINLAALLFLILEYIIYLFIVLIVVKYTWKLARNIWKK